MGWACSAYGGGEGAVWALGRENGGRERGMYRVLLGKP